MNIPLANFESKIGKNILSRGRQYAKHSVRQLDEVADGKWLAIVEGTRRYDVEVILKNGDIVESSCTCPYDLGPHCKHEIAVWYAISE